MEKAQINPSNRIGIRLTFSSQEEMKKLYIVGQLYFNDILSTQYKPFLKKDNFIEKLICKFDTKGLEI